MKTLLMTAALSMMSFSTFAACDASIFNTDGTSVKAFQTEIAQILTEKGYNVIEDDRSNALQDAGRLIVDISTLYFLSNDGCTTFSNGRVECAVTINAGKSTNGGLTTERSAINLSTNTRSTIFTSQAKITSKFKQQVLDQAAGLIPECR